MADINWENLWNGGGKSPRRRASGKPRRKVADSHGTPFGDHEPGRIIEPDRDSFLPAPAPPLVIEPAPTDRLHLEEKPSILSLIFCESCRVGESVVFLVWNRVTIAIISFFLAVWLLTYATEFALDKCFDRIAAWAGGMFKTLFRPFNWSYHLVKNLAWATTEYAPPIATWYADAGVFIGSIAAVVMNTTSTIWGRETQFFESVPFQFQQPIPVVESSIMPKCLANIRSDIESIDIHPSRADDIAQLTVGLEEAFRLAAQQADVYRRLNENPMRNLANGVTWYHHQLSTLRSRLRATSSELQDRDTNERIWARWYKSFSDGRKAENFKSELLKISGNIHEAHTSLFQHLQDERKKVQAGAICRVNDLLLGWKPTMVPSRQEHDIIRTSNVMCISSSRAITRWDQFQQALKKNVIFLQSAHREVWGLQYDEARTLYVHLLAQVEKLMQSIELLADSGEHTETYRNERDD